MLKNNTMLSSKYDGLELSGYQKKLKTMKKKYFALYKDTLNGVARLEYYDNEKKFKQGLEPKRVIKLKNCFNINRRFDTKHEHVLALSTRDGGFGIVLDNENELRKWMETLRALHHQSGQYLETSYPLYDYVWQVNVQKKGIAEEKGLLGNYHVCLTTKSLTFISIGPEKNANGESRITNVEVLLTTIRRCGDSQCFFYMEIGRQSVIGPGELWMEADDVLIAQNMHKMILSKMSVKSESNSNLTSLGHIKYEAITTEDQPMRKRSSSANEASKPVNVLQKRQIPIEIKACNSPQNDLQIYGRERCDSLPTRNRTSSECSPQAYTTSINTFRSNTLSGYRPYSYQRHSNSPPMATQVTCSESEESSVSVDEPDDGGPFIGYRFNSRSSEGVIPEENTDDFTLAEKCKEDTDTFQENYIAMAPVKPDLKDLTTLNQFRKKAEDAKNMSIMYNMANAGSSKFNCDFPEHNSENLARDMEIDVDQQYDRPARAYSIGSKVEHIKTTNKRIGNNTHDADNHTIRVRAFSVGSRAKIPRCDLQRGVLFSKARIEQNFNNSNNNISPANDLILSNEVSIGVARDKKSTSAPLLIPKNQNYDDHMEIDFSKKYNRNYSSTKINQIKTAYCTKRNNSKRNDMRAYSFSHNSESEAPGISASSFQYSASNSSSQAAVESGYLEMKPVGSLSSNIDTQQQQHTKMFAAEILPSQSTSSNATEETKMPNLIQLHHEAGAEKKAMAKMSTAQTTVFEKEVDTLNEAPERNWLINDTKNYILPEETAEKAVNTNVKSDLHNTNMEIEDSKRSKTVIPIDNSSPRNLLDNFNKLNLETSKENEMKNTVITDNYIKLDTNIRPKDYKSMKMMVSHQNNTTIRHKQHELELTCEQAVLCHSMSNDSASPIQNLDKTDLSTGGGEPRNEVGYKILQIKSDSSLQSNKIIHRPSSIRDNNNKNQQRPSKVSQATEANCKNMDNTRANMAGIVSTSTHVGSVTTHFNFNSSSPKTSSDSSAGNSSASSSKVVLDSLSRPPSVTSEHELYYASLDLPQCSVHGNVKTPKKETVEFEVAPIAAATVAHTSNSYAKIDFELSDSSSSSSKKVLNI